VKAAGRHTIGLIVTILSWSLVTTPTEGASAKEAAPEARVTTDFNGDGFADLAMGVPEEDLGGVSNVGAVEVLYGSAAGLSADASQFWTADTPGVPGDADDGDEFGSSLGSGDFDGDGFSDLAIGVIFDSFGGLAVGSVVVLYGSAKGLTTSEAQHWGQNVPGIKGRGETSEWFGFELAADDFDGDGMSDLAVGVPGDDAPDGSNGAVNVLYGTPDGLAVDRNQLWFHGSSGILGDGGGNFGETLSTGDYNGDGWADLSVGTIYDNLGSVLNAGSVSVIYGSPLGLTSSGNQLWKQDVPGLGEEVEQFDCFGMGLGSGDLNGDGFDDLTVGVPFEDLEDVKDAGLLHVIYGSPTGLSSSGSQVWTQDSPGVAERVGARDRFGSAAIGSDFNGDSISDLAVSAAFENLSGIPLAGAVHVLYGTAEGVSASGNQLWTQDSADIEDSSEDGDLYGEVLGTGDFNGDGAWELAVGVPFEALEALGNAGAMSVLYGSTPEGLSGGDDQFWTQDSAGVADSAERDDLFGWL
jgi:hypothetical protein